MAANCPATRGPTSYVFDKPVEEREREREHDYVKGQTVEQMYAFVIENCLDYMMMINVEEARQSFVQTRRRREATDIVSSESIEHVGKDTNK